MAFGNPLNLSDASGDSVTFVLISQSADGSRRIDQATNLVLPAFLNVRHTQAGPRDRVVDRHLIQMTRDVSTTSGPVTLGANFTLNVPRASEVTSQLVYDLVMNLIDMLGSGGYSTLPATTHIDALLRGES